MKKINSIHYGGIWIGAGLVIGGLIPLIVFLVSGIIVWWLIAAGGIILAAFFVLFAIEMRQDFGKVPYYQKHLRETIPYDPEKEEAVIRCSICTGEKVAGFRNKENGHFKEVMVLRTPEDEEQFFHIYGIRNVKKEY